MAMPMLADWSLGTTIPAKDLDGTRRFYEDVLGAQVVTEDPGGIIYRSGDSYFSLYPTARMMVEAPALRSDPWNPLALLPGIGSVGRSGRASLAPPV